jgi:hypothetical protein
MAFNDNWDGIQRNNTQPQPLNEGYFELDDMADNIRKTADKPMKSGEVSTYLKQIAGSLRLAHQQNQDFLQGLLFHLEGIHKKTMSPSKHGNMEIMRDLETVIRELKKYKK